MRRFDHVVVGAGIVGAFVAHGLAARGAEVALLDRKDPGLEASGTNAGTLAAQNKPMSLIPLAVDGIRRWQAFEDEHGIDLETTMCGGFRVAHDPAGVETLRGVAERQRAVGVPTEHLSGDAVRERAPYVGPAVLAANWSEMDGYNNALIATALVVHDACRLGATFLRRTEVLEMRREGESWLLETDQGPIRASRVVVAAGYWVRTLMEPLGLELPIAVRNNQMMVTSRMPPLLDHVISHVTGRLTLKQKHVGTVLIGGGWPGHHDPTLHRKWPSLASMAGNARLARDTVPALADAMVVRAWAGIDGRADHQEPYIGPVDGLEGLVLATTCWGAYTLAPTIAQGAVDWTLENRATPGLERFTPREQLRRGARA
jgi:sarcosine oxidase subunit beta